MPLTDAVCLFVVFQYRSVIVNVVARRGAAGTGAVVVSLPIDLTRFHLPTAVRVAADVLSVNYEVGFDASALHYV